MATFARHLMPLIYGINLLFIFILDKTLETRQKNNFFNKEHIFYIVALFLIILIFYSLVLSLQFGVKDERTTSSEWIVNNIPLGSKILIDKDNQNWMLPDLFRTSQIKNYTFIKDPLSNYDYAVLSDPRMIYSEFYLKNKSDYNDITQFPDRVEQYTFYQEFYSQNPQLVVKFDKDYLYSLLFIKRDNSPYEFWSITSPGIRVYKKESKFISSSQ